jgi:hypothetical protein
LAAAATLLERYRGTVWAREPEAPRCCTTVGIAAVAALAGRVIGMLVDRWASA